MRTQEPIPQSYTPEQRDIASAAIRICAAEIQILEKDILALEAAVWETIPDSGTRNSAIRELQEFDRIKQVVSAIGTILNSACTPENIESTIQSIPLEYLRLKFESNGKEKLEQEEIEFF